MQWPLSLQLWLSLVFSMLEPCSNLRMVNFCFQCMLDLLIRKNKLIKLTIKSWDGGFDELLVMGLWRMNERDGSGR